MTLQRNVSIAVLFCMTLVVGAIYGHKLYEGKVAGIRTDEQPKLLRGMIVSHHKLAHTLIDESYQKASKQQYSHIVIFSPNHYYPNAPSVMTTPEISGIKVDTAILDVIFQKFPDMHSDPEMIRGEHGIILQTEYIRHYFPNAQVVPLVVSRVLTREKAVELGNILASALPEDTLYIASVDFSHNVTIEEGLDKNEETLSVLARFDTQQLYTFGDDHLDAPFATSVWLIALNTLNSRHFELWHSSHSGILTDDAQTKGTSYVFGGFYQ